MRLRRAERSKGHEAFHTVTSCSEASFLSCRRDPFLAQAAQVVGEEDAVQVVDLVADGAGQVLLGVELERLAREVLRPHGDRQRAVHLVGDPGQGEAPLGVGLRALAPDDLGIDQDAERSRVLPHRDVHHGEAEVDPHLGRGEADAGGGVHGLDHVGGELAQRRRRRSPPAGTSRRRTGSG